MIMGSPKILLLKMSALGDVVHTLPTLETLRANHPNAHIAWMIEERFQCLIEGHPALDEIIPVNTKRWRREIDSNSIREIFKIFRQIRKRKFDIVLDLHGLIKSGVISYASGASRRVGFSTANCKEAISSLFNNNKAPRINPDCHVVSANLQVLQTAIPCANLRYDFILPQSTSADEKINRFIQSHTQLLNNPVVAVNPGAGFESKRWSLEKFSALADGLTTQLGLSVLLTWGPGEEKMVQQIAETMKQNCWIAPPTTIVESIALYRRMAFFVGNDSGPLHLSAALGIPSLALFGPTNPARNGPFGAHTQTEFKRLTCSFCWKRTCPLGTNECMNSIAVEDVLARAEKMLPSNLSPQPQTS
ncbi:MAG: lipopolysaccharide heptosyltransferase I [Nitrospinae bacterium CG11_big_fil_rev_8_21_14_0_20_45_15]|nr:MAG: lipopolysaccharide heptosyltransferase I [Nitrospinae bacterium CG11_big_fil_rev_8_21_14_0_20_45_15]